MQKLAIVGGAPLRGDVRISGAKNAALPIMCASLLTAESLRLTNVPDLHDVVTMRKLLQQKGMAAEVAADRVAAGVGGVARADMAADKVGDRAGAMAAGAGNAAGSRSPSSIPRSPTFPRR